MERRKGEARLESSVVDVVEMGRTGMLRTPLSRRRLVKLLAGAGALAVAGGVSVARPAAAGAGVDYRTTTAVNLRAKPSSKAQILKVLPAGTVGTDYDGEIANGYRSLDFSGSVGWVYDDYLVQVDDDPDFPEIIGAAETTTDVNFRAGPSANHQVLRVVAKGTWVEISATVQNGYRQVLFDGLVGWIYDDYLNWPHDGPQGVIKTTTANLSLRAQPNLQAAVLLVIPANSDVEAGDQFANGFRMVTYKGTTGWASTAYLA